MVVVEKTMLAEGIVRLTLQDQDGRELPRWSPGSHVDLIAGGQTRQYCCAVTAVTAGVSRWPCWMRRMAAADPASFMSRSR